MKGTLEQGEGGRWLVRTRTSSYLLDLDAMTGVRNPVGDDGGYCAASLRKDAQEWRIVELACCTLGSPMTLIARDVADDPQIVTVRRSTPVTGIAPA